MSSPLVSVIVAVRNGERYLSSALTSILNQDYRPLEILVVDGHSEDRTAEIAQSFEHVRYLVQQGRGIADAYNLGIAAAGGDLIAFLSHDDLWLPMKLSLQVSHLIEHPEVQYTITMMRYFLEPGNEIPPGFKKDLLAGQYAGRVMETLVARRSVFAAIGGFDTSMALAEDADWYARASDHGIAMSIIPEVLLLKRIHSANASSDARTSNRELLKALKRSIERKKFRVDARQDEP
jgi:glycosyltransferase involved in cell wall biosynthesis